MVHAKSKAIRKRKPKKDPKFPKRPRSAYIHFCQAKRAAVKEENPDVRPPQVLQLLAKLWNSLTEDDKAPYTAMHDEDKAKFEEDMKNYEPSEGFDEKGKEIVESESESEEEEEEEDESE